MPRSHALAVLLLAAGVHADDSIQAYLDYQRVVRATAGMVGDAKVRELAAKHGLEVLDLTWEDTGRAKDSAVGPNISDMTIQVQTMDPRTEEFTLTCMPVIRFPNFEDVTGDVATGEFFLLTGNEKGRALARVSLKDYLADFRTYLHDPASWSGSARSLLAPGRDSHVLVSAQACFLPVPKDGIAEFNPVLFNYQSYEGDPAVLAVLVTREGTSATVIDNARDQFAAGEASGQRLFFNKDGDRAGLTAERKSDFERKRSSWIGTGRTPPPLEAVKDEALNMVLLIQVPLKQKSPRPMSFDFFDDGAVMSLGGGMDEMAMEDMSADVEEAVIGHGEIEGPFTEIAGLEIERDPQFPVRVTVQFYLATSNGVVTAKHMDDIAAQIRRVYDQADWVGSLVVGGETGRPTEPDPAAIQPDYWWRAHFLERARRTGTSAQELEEGLVMLHGPAWHRKTVGVLMRSLERLGR